MKHVLAVFVAALLLLPCLSGCNPQGTEASAGFPVTKVVFPENTDRFRLYWDYNGDGEKDEFITDVIGSGISHESLSSVNAKTGKRTLLCQSVNCFTSLGFAEGDDTTPLIYNGYDALFSPDMTYAFVEPIAKIVSENGKPVIVPLNQGGSYTVEMKLAENGGISSTQFALNDAESKDFIDGKLLDGLSGFYADIRYGKAISENNVLHIEYEYKTLNGKDAKALYRALTEAAGSDMIQNDHIDVSYDTVRADFMTKSAGDYFFCGSFCIQKRGGAEYMSVKTGALHDRGITFKLENSVYDSAAQITGLGK